MIYKKENCILLNFDINTTARKKFGKRTAYNYFTARKKFGQRTAFAYGFGNYEDTGWMKDLANMPHVLPSICSCAKKK